MKCPDEQTLAAFMEGELSTNAAGELQIHLADCAGCRQAIERLRETIGQLRLARAVEDPHFVSQLLDRLPASRRRHPGRWLVALALAAAAAFVVFWGVSLHRRDGEFVARGNAKPGLAEPATHLGVEVFVHPQSRDKNRVAMRGGERVENGDGFSFVVSNRFGRDVYLCLFAILLWPRPFLSKTTFKDKTKPSSRLRMKGTEPRDSRRPTCCGNMIAGSRLWTSSSMTPQPSSTPVALPTCCRSISVARRSRTSRSGTQPTYGRILSRLPPTSIRSPVVLQRPGHSFCVARCGWGPSAAARRGATTRLESPGCS
jgi:hypothetical protein